MTGNSDHHPIPTCVEYWTLSMLARQLEPEKKTDALPKQLVCVCGQTIAQSSSHSETEHHLQYPRTAVFERIFLHADLADDLLRSHWMSVDDAPRNQLQTSYCSPFLTYGEHS